jgi:hypothetical protein
MRCFDRLPSHDYRQREFELLITHLGLKVSSPVNCIQPSRPKQRSFVTEFCEGGGLGAGNLYAVFLTSALVWRHGKLVGTSARPIETPPGSYLRLHRLTPITPAT